MTFYAYVAVFLLLLPLQASLLAPLTRIGLVPDLGLAVLAVIGLLAGPFEGAAAGIAIGLYLDISSASILGLSGLTRGLTGMAAGLLGQRVLDIRGPATAVFIGLFSLLDSLLGTLYLEATYDDFPVVRQFFGRMLPRAMMTALAGYWLLRFILRRNVLPFIRRRDLPKEL